MTSHTTLELVSTGPDKAPVRLAEAQAVFDTLDVSESTLADYKARIGRFLRLVRRTGLTPDSFLNYKRILAARTDLTAATKNKYLAAARVFLRELHRRGYLPVDITANVKSFSQSKRHKRTGITDEEMTLLTGRIRELDLSPNNARLRAILCLLGLQGLRQVEICRLDVTDLDLNARTAMVQGKGQDDKEPIDLLPETVTALAEHIRINYVADGPLFCGFSNNSRRLTTRGLRLIVDRTLRELGLCRTVHGFRHYFTTKLIEAYGGDLLTVAQYTRHRSLEMLQVYNDSVKRQADLPRFYETFGEVKFGPDTAPDSHNSNYRK
ncbi:MAG: tyrosine-type recombinase/integrase [Candidatus Zixiibacteriota bacterium]